MKIAQPCLTSTGLQSISIQQALSLLPSAMPMQPRILVCDGSGQNSTADHSIPQHDRRLDSLRAAFMSYVQDNNLMQQLASHLSQAHNSHPLSEKQQLDLACLAHAVVHPGCTDTNCLSIREDQPFRLLLQAIAQHIDDPDIDLTPILLEGVPTGAFAQLPPSKQWIPNSLQDPQESDPLHLQHCAGNWTQAERNPAVLQELIDKELQDGYIACFDGTEADAKLHWPKGAAIGKLNVVLAQGRDPRMVLDSTICNLNPRCHLPERVQMPTHLHAPRPTRVLARPLTGLQGSAQSMRCTQRRKRHTALPAPGQIVLLQGVSFRRKIQQLLVAKTRLCHPPHTAPPAQPQTAPQLPLRG